MKFKEQDIILKCGADMFLPFALVFGLYVILFGSVSSGGGFQGGVIVTSAFLLVYLGYGVEGIGHVISPRPLRIHGGIAACLYVALGFIGILFGRNFASNVFAQVGDIGDFISAGTITFMSYVVGYRVVSGIGLLLLLMTGLLTSPDDEEPETDIAYGFDSTAEEGAES